MARKKNDRASRAEVIAIHARLADTIIKHDGGMVSYIEGVSDLTIAQELNVSANSVALMRLEMFGKFRQAVSRAPDPRLDDVVKVAENILAKYEELRDRHNKLVSLLALNRVVDCKHLAVT